MIYYCMDDVTKREYCNLIGSLAGYYYAIIISTMVAYNQNKIKPLERRLRF